MYGERTYRLKSAFVIIGLVFAVVPLSFFTLPALYHLATGTTLPMSDGKGTNKTHPSTQQELLMMACFPLIHVAVGVGLCLAYKNVVVKTDESGITARNFLGKTSFQSNWRDLQALEQVPGRNARPISIVKAADQQLRIGDWVGGYPDLLQAIEDNAPQISRASG